MKTNSLTFIFLLICYISLGQNLPKVSSGRIVRHANFKSTNVATRNVDVWLPEGYNASKKYNVIYMHDGQMLFDSAQTWNKKEWKVDEVISQLIAEKKIESCIVVGIWNNGSERISEYYPNKIFNLLDEKTQKLLSEKYCNGKTANGDNYLKFVVEEVKRFIDKTYSTNPDKEHTFMLGSSMGGLISVYAISEYPEVFGGAACISTAWLSSIEPNYEIQTAVFQYLRTNMAMPLGHKIYMDYGTGESDKPYELTQSFVDLIAKGKGYRDSNYMSKVFNKAEHDEVAWSQRLHVSLEFLLKK
jgi:predicted alpha/beta superfamily hydrolase